MTSVQTENVGDRKPKKTAGNGHANEMTQQPVEDIAELAKSVEDATCEAVTAGETMMVRGLDLYREGLRFVAERIKRDIELQENLLDCRQPRDFYEVQAGFLETMARQYAAEYQKLMGTAFPVNADQASDGDRKAA